MLNSTGEEHNNDSFHDDIEADIAVIWLKDNNEDAMSNSWDSKDHWDSEDIIWLFEGVLSYWVRVAVASISDIQIFIQYDQVDSQELYWVFD